MTQQYKSLEANKIRRIWQFRVVSVQMNVKNKCLWRQKFLESKSESIEVSSQLKDYIFPTVKSALLFLSYIRPVFTNFVDWEKEYGTFLLTIQKLKQMSHEIAFVKGVVDEKTWNVYTVHFLHWGNWCQPPFFFLHHVTLRIKQNVFKRSVYSVYWCY